jgi:putative transposase
MEAAGRFLAQAKDVVGHAPERVSMDKHHPYPRAIRRTPGRKVVQRASRYLNNILEQDRRAVKQRSCRGYESGWP